MKVALCTLVKNEAKDIGEWVGHHLGIGIDTIIAFDNGSLDGTQHLLRKAAAHADIRVFDWPFHYPRQQIDAFFVAAGAHAEEFDWMVFLDADEFLIPDLHTPLRSLLNQRNDAAAIAVNWSMFGSSGFQEDPSEGLLGGFLHRAPDQFGPNAHVKMIVQPKKVQGCINPHCFKVDGPIQTPMGAPVAWAELPGLARTITHEGLRVHHYFTRSKDAWARRMARGQTIGSRTWKDFDDYDRNEVKDTTGLLFAPTALARRHQLGL